MKKVLLFGILLSLTFSLPLLAADAYLDVGPTPADTPPEECPELLDPEGDYSDPAAGTDAADGSEASCRVTGRAGPLPYSWLWPFYYTPKIGGGPGRMWW